MIISNSLVTEKTKLDTYRHYVTFYDIDISSK